MGRIWENVKAAFSSEPLSSSNILDRLITAVSNSGGVLATIDRDYALSVPAVLRGRNLICSIATLPLIQQNRRFEIVPSTFLEQIDPNRPNLVTLAMTVEDLLFDRVAYWRITDQFYDDYPAHAVRVDPRRVTENEERGVIVLRIDGKRVDWSQIIKFESPNPGILHGAGGQTIRRAIALDMTASLYANNPRPLDYFTGKDIDPPEKKILEFLEGWVSARRSHTTAYVPTSFIYSQVEAPTPQQLQLVEQIQQASLDISNLMGVDPEDLGVSTTSRTYANISDRRQERINNTLSPYMQAITSRLSMGDVTKNGNRVTFDLDDYMKADPLTRTQYYKGLSDLNAITPDEIRIEEKMAPIAKPIRAEVVSSVPLEIEGGPGDGN